MTIEELRGKVNITKEGAILLGRNIACDGTTIDRPISVISHAHGDHTKTFETALSHCTYVLMTPQTKDLLIAERGNWLRKRTNLVGLPYSQRFTFDNESITLYPVKHMFGACQVLFEDPSGTRIVYTGDFNWPSTKVLEADVVVMEATYGDKSCVRESSEEELFEKMVELIQNELKKEKPVFVLAHRGKIQCLANRFYKKDICVPILLGKKDLVWIKIYEQYGNEMGEIYDNRTEEAKQIQKTKKSFIALNRIGSTVPDAEDCLVIRASGYMARKDIYSPRKNYYVIALSDHADFIGLLEYAKRSQAKLVITDNTRCSNAQKLADELTKIGIKAMALPP